MESLSAAAECPAGDCDVTHVQIAIVVEGERIVDHLKISTDASIAQLSLAATWLERYKAQVVAQIDRMVKAQNGGKA